MPLDHFVICPDKQTAAGESADAGAEMTEEEWNLRVAELNKHQVCVGNLKSHKNDISPAVFIKLRVTIQLFTPLGCNDRYKSVIQNSTTAHRTGLKCGMFYFVWISKQFSSPCN